MKIKAVTIDFWNTLFDSSNGEPRNLVRRDSLLQAIREAGHACDDVRFDLVYRGIWNYFDEQWLNHHRTPTSSEMIDQICNQLEMQIGREEAERVSDIFSRGVLDHPPELLPGAREGLAFLAEHAKLAIISDTAFSPGIVLRELMMEQGIDRYFSAYVFSDETGVAKPRPEAFTTALQQLDAEPESAFHIGDIERTDICGARGAGMKAVLYKGDNVGHKYVSDQTDADVVMGHWSEIEEVWQRLTTPATPTIDPPAIEPLAKAA